MPAASGIGNYLLSAAEGMRALPDGRLRIIAAPEEEAGWRARQPEARVVRCARRWYSVTEQVAIPWHVRGADLLHVPHYNIPLAYRGPLISTIHDVMHLVFPGYADGPLQRTYAKIMLRAAVRRSRRVVTVSRFSRGEIIRMLGTDPAKLCVIHNGVNPAHVASDSDLARADSSEKCGFSGPFLLYVGNTKPHKNLTVLGRAFARLAAERASLRLILALGGDPPPAWARGQARVRALPRLADADLVSLYRSAAALVQPSLCEGFGYPVVEAMASGTPVICADAGALPEVAGDAAEYFAPRDAEALAAAVARVLDDPGRRRCRQEAGRSRVERMFSWRRCAAEHAELYAEVLAETRGRRWAAAGTVANPAGEDE